MSAPLRGPLIRTAEHHCADLSEHHCTDSLGLNIPVIETETEGANHIMENSRTRNEENHNINYSTTIYNTQHITNGSCQNYSQLIN